MFFQCLCECSSGTLLHLTIQSHAVNGIMLTVFSELPMVVHVSVDVVCHSVLALQQSGDL